MALSYGLTNSLVTSSVVVRTMSGVSSGSSVNTSETVSSSEGPMAPSLSRVSSAARLCTRYSWRAVDPPSVARMERFTGSQAQLPVRFVISTGA